MKIRIRDNSIRMRLTKSEVKLLSESGSVAARTQFVDSPDAIDFRYTLSLSDQDDRPTAAYKNGVMSISLPTKVGMDWALGNDVAVKADQSVGDGSLVILVEKDFACLTPRDDEEETEMYEHPSAGSATC